MAMNEHDLDPLDDLEDDDEPRALVRHLRAKIKDQRRQLANAFEDGKTAGRDEEQRDQAWKTTGIPASVRALMGDVDPRDPDALTSSTSRPHYSSQPASIAKTSASRGRCCSVTSISRTVIHPE
jgi:hypothetical protein